MLPSLPLAISALRSVRSKSSKYGLHHAEIYVELKRFTVTEKVCCKLTRF